MRYPALDAKNVLDAGGRDEGGCTSLWLVSWGAQSVHGVYPKESNGGLSHEDLKTYMAQDPDGRKYQVVGDKYNWRCGLAVRDWRGIVRIANLPVASLGKRKGQSGFVDMQKLTIEAKNLMPQHLRQKAVWYANADVLTALELQNSDAGNVQLQYGEFFDSKAVPVLHVFKVDGDNLQCDLALAPWEAALGARVEVPTLEGSVEMQIPAGSSSGRKFRLRGKGLGAGDKRGDLLAKIMASCGADAPSRPAGRRPMQFQARDAARQCSVDASLLSLSGAAPGLSAGPALCNGNKRRTASHCASHCATPPQSM